MAAFLHIAFVDFGAQGQNGKWHQTLVHLSDKMFPAAGMRQSKVRIAARGKLSFLGHKVQIDGLVADDSRHNVAQATNFPFEPIKGE